jgi:hypothetical protein
LHRIAFVFKQFLKSNIKQEKKMKRIAFCTVGLAALMTTACQDHSNLYDSDYANAVKQQEYSQSFPVQNIDPTQDWNLYTTANVQVTVNEDWGETYTVKVYTANPLDETSGALLLAKGEVKNGETFSTQISVPKAQEGAFVALLNSKGEKIVKYAEIANSKIATEFGVASSRSYTGNAPSIEPVYQDCPYTEAEVAALIENAFEIPDSWMWNSSNYFTEGSVYKYSRDTDFSASAWGDITVIITNGANVTMVQNPNAKMKIIVENGSLTLTQNWINMGNMAQLVILKDGVVYGATGDKYNMNTLPNYTYNAGVIKNGSVCYKDIYNCGTIDVDYWIDASWEEEPYHLYNNGYIHASVEFDSKGAYVYNNCYLHFAYVSNLGQLTMADNSYLKVDGICWVGGGEKVFDIKLGKSAIFNVGELKNNKAQFIAPSSIATSDKSEYAYIKFGSVTQWNNGLNNFKGYYIIDPGDYTSLDNTGYKGQGKDSPYTSYPNFETEALGIKWSGHDVSADQHPTITDLTITDPNYANGECNGTTSIDPVDPEEDDNNDQSDYVYYAFEDLGSIGDYDFNDVVLRVYDADENGNAKVELVAAGGKLTVSVVYGSQTLWSDVHGADAFNTTDYVNVGTNEYNSNYPTKTINTGSTPKHQLYNLQLVVQNESGTSQQLASTVVSSKADTGKAPQALIIPAGWKWPTELQSLCKVYNTEDFSIIDWMENKDSSVNWYLNVKSGYESLVVTPK